MSAEPLRRVRLCVRGLVQGVNFRYYASLEARRRGVTGWIRNREDGEVEIIAEGAPEVVAALEAWCRRGPPAAAVEEVVCEELAGPRRYPDFAVVYRAPE